jgi:hypothetical protein
MKATLKCSVSFEHITFTHCMLDLFWLITHCHLSNGYSPVILDSALMEQWNMLDLLGAYFVAFIDTSKLKE